MRAVRHHRFIFQCQRLVPAGDGGWLNGSFFVLSPKVCSYVDGDAAVWEREPLERHAAEGQLSVHFALRLLAPMDSLRDR